MSTVTVRAGRRAVEVSNAEKVLYPDDGITKADLAEYYEHVASRMLPHLRDRPIAMERYPDGIDDGRLFQKNAGRHFPEWITRARVEKVGGFVQHVIVDQAATLVYLANQACITLHTFLSTLDRIRSPDQLIFDLDPPGDEFQLARKTALDLRAILEEDLGLVSFVKTTGGDGLHVVVPLDASEDFDAVRAFASDVGALIVQRHPERVTMEPRKNRRGKRLYLDVMRNAYAQTAVAPYSARARRKATVAMPIDWDDVRDSKLRPERFTIATVPRRLRTEPDPWAAIARKAQTIAKARRRLAEASLPTTAASRR